MRFTHQEIYGVGTNYENTYMNLKDKLKKAYITKLKVEHGDSDTASTWY